MTNYEEYEELETMAYERYVNVLHCSNDQYEIDEARREYFEARDAREDYEAKVHKES